MEMLKLVYTTICCTRLCQVYTAENSKENIKCDEKIHHDKLQDLPKAIFTTDKNITQTEHLDKDVVKIIIAPNISNEIYEEFSENSKIKSSNASTSISKKFCSDNASDDRFAEQRKCIQKQNSKKEEWKMEVIITGNNSFLTHLDEPHKYDALKSIYISSKIDAQDLLKLSSWAESTRLCVPQSVVTYSTENCKCRTGNITTSTAYISCQENDKAEDKAKKSRKPFGKLRKRIVTIFRRYVTKNVL